MEKGLHPYSQPPTDLLFVQGFIDGLEQCRNLISCGFGYFGFYDGKVTDYKETEKEIGLRQTERERITANNYPFSFHS